MGKSTDKNHDAAHLALALQYQLQGDFEKAIEECKQVIKLNKNNKTAINYLVQLYEAIADKHLASHQPVKAVENYQLAVDYAPENLYLMYKLAFSISRIGDFNRAIKISRSILGKDNNHAPAKSLLAAIYEKTGEIDEGWRLSESLIYEWPKNPFIAITYGKYALRNNRQMTAIPKLQHVLNQSGLKIDDRLSIHMLQGKLYDSVSDYKNAFMHFSQANNLKYNDYDIDAFEVQVSKIIKYFSQEKFSNLPFSNNDSAASIYIVGMPRSGTSLVEQIVSSHSKVYGGGELQYIPNIINSMQATDLTVQYPHLIGRMSSNVLNGYAKEVLTSMQALSSNSQKITDKLPHNFLFLGLIHKLLPEAKIINCLRNPIDTCLSCYFQHFGGYHPYAYNLSHLGKYYLQYIKLMRHWEELRIPILNVQYEDLVLDAKNETQNILNYLDLEWEDECLEFYKQKRAINTSSYTQVTKNVYTGSMSRWRNYKPYIGELINILGEHC